MKRLLAILAVLALAAGCSTAGHKVKGGVTTGLSIQGEWEGPPRDAAPGEVNIHVQAGEGVGYSISTWTDAPVPTVEQKTTGPVWQPRPAPPVPADD